MTILKMRLHKAIPVQLIFFIIFIASTAVGQRPTTATPQPVAVRYVEGVTRGFMVAKAQDGRKIADGDMGQIAKGDRVTSRMTFRFKDGSTFEETTVFTQQGNFRLLSDQVVKKGPTFKHPVEDTSINASTGQVVVRYTDDKGKEKVVTKQLDLPSDLSNGLLLIILKNIQPTTQNTTVSYLATTPEPRIVKFVISPQGEEPLLTGGSKHSGMNYDVKVDIGGVVGAIARLVGKQPPDTHVWVLLGDAPSFAGLEGPFFREDSVSQIDLVSPVRPKSQD
jgi:hypothetical protein